MNPKLKKVISLVSEMDDARLDALLLLLQEPLPDYDLPEDDKWIVRERTEKYKRGEDKGIPAKVASKQIREMLKKRRK